MAFCCIVLILLSLFCIPCIYEATLYVVITLWLKELKKEKQTTFSLFNNR